MIRGRRFGILDERRDPAVLRAADPDPLLDPGELVRAGVRARLGIGDVDGVVPGDEDAARPPELPPFVENTAVLIENLDPVVLAIAAEQPAARADGNRVRFAKL